jgi:hypothetical protein
MIEAPLFRGAGYAGLTLRQSQAAFFLRAAGKRGFIGPEKNMRLCEAASCHSLVNMLQPKSCDLWTAVTRYYKVARYFSARRG